MSKDAEWPPRSPHDVLLSTPGGRDRLRRLAERASPSPSPIKRTTSTASIRRQARDLLGSSMDGGADSEDDEETLQLQLQEIQARLKLKRLQKKSKHGSESENEVKLGAPSLSRANSVAADRAQSRLEGIRERQLQRSKSQTNIEVPVSPIRRAPPVEPHKSPQRVLLGIDKGLTGRDISLKRAPSLRRKDETDAPDRKLGPFLQRPISQASGRQNSTAASAQNDDRPKNFNERMAAMRSQDTERQEREARIKRTRSMAFDIDHEQLERFKEAAVELPEQPHRPVEFSREDVLNAYNKPNGTLPRSSTVPSLRSAIKTPNVSTDSPATLSNRSDSRTSVDVPTRKHAPAKRKVPPNEVTEADASQFEPYSATHLSKRIIPHQVLTRTFTGKKTFLIPDLLRTVKAPDFLGPDIEEDVVVLAVVAKKTEPRSHKTDGSKRGKYMIMGLTDLKWELDLALFDSAFDKFYKLAPGTIIAILNPSFMPPPRGRTDTGKFSLVLNSGEDTILEIGNARDLGFCKSVKKDGNTCETWVDKRHTEFCDFHVNLTLEKTRAQRMEVNTMNFGKKEGGRKWNSKDMTGHFDYKKKSEKDKKSFYDPESHSNVFVGKRTTANLLDDNSYDPDAFHRGSSKEERMTRQILAQEKERELERKLGKLGSGLGADYMRAKQSFRAGASRRESENEIVPPPPPEAAKLGLLGGNARDIRLSPIKRKRTNTSSSTAARGWGSDLSKDLGRMKDGKNLLPVKKKTRFITEKGIREAGRESIGGPEAKAVLHDLDDDDDSELDIVRE
ncbi:cell division cycle protein [Amylocarpus encephaloides]|uniref:Cell division cycle protein n=1 Tax=Amylocarpus encephaloides TaxID=45428 RepID=A0A9P7YPD7_9HELO|nr:cell division cycle protein [Amylocarpus encephaloides]